MIWFNISKLEEKISKNELSDKDGFNYVLAYFIMGALTIGIHSEIENHWIKFISSILLVLITIWGLNRVYKANNEIDGKDFFKRFFAIYWVIGMRMLLAIIIIAFLLGFVVAIISLTGGGANIDKNPFKDLTTSISVLVFEIIFYLLVTNSIHKLKPIAE